jgi:hypothetical protein
VVVATPCPQRLHDGRHFVVGTVRVDLVLRHQAGGIQAARVLQNGRLA